MRWEKAVAKHSSYRLLHVMQHGDDSWHMVWDAVRWQPRVDVCRDQNTLYIQVEVPGVEDDDLRLHFEPGQLIVEGQRERRQFPHAVQCLRMEAEYGPFRRTIPLPPDADADNIVARFQSGQLLIDVPLKQPLPPQTVRVNID
jgi:HSP20 family protein